MRLALALAAAAVLAAAAPAHAARTVTPAGVRSPAVALGPAGDTALAWERSTGSGVGVRARVGRGPARLGRTQRLAARGGSPPLVAVGHDGTSAVLWVQRGARRAFRLRLAVARRGGRLGAPRTVASGRGTAEAAGLAVQRGGRVVALLRRSAARSVLVLARGRTVTRTPLRAGAALARDPADDTVLVGVEAPPGLAVLGRAVARPGTPVPLLADPGPGDEVLRALVTGPGGTAALVESFGTSRTLLLASLEPDRAVAAARQVAADPGADRYATAPTAAVPSAGGPVVAWLDERWRGGDTDVLVASAPVVAVAQPDGAFAPPVALAAPLARRRQVRAVAAGERVHVAWTAGPRGPVRVVTRPTAGASFGAPRTLSARGDGDVVLAAAGARAVAVWQERDRLRLAVLPAR